MAALQPIESIGLGDSAFESIRTAIINGDLAPGEPLRDRTIALALGISRTPVREAFHRLEATGLVEPLGRVGWKVGTFSATDVHEIFQMRRLLEPVGIDQLEKARDEEAIHKLVTFFDDYDSPISDTGLAGYFERDQAFHECIVKCSGNRRIVQAYSVMSNHISRGRRFLIRSATGRADETLHEHRAVTGALSTGDFAGAREALIAHLTVGENLLSALVSSETQDIGVES